MCGLQEPAGPTLPLQVALALSGTAKVGETLTADISGITDDNGLVGVSFSYTWGANDGLLLGQSVVPTYTIRPKDVGLGIDVTAHFTDDDGYHEQTTSTATSAVQAATPAPPQNLKVSKEGKGSLDLKWDTPVVDMEGLRNGKGTKGDGGSPIRKYKVQWKESANTWDTPEEVSEDAVSEHHPYHRRLDGGYAVRRPGSRHQRRRRRRPRQSRYPARLNWGMHRRLESPPLAALLR